MCPEYLSHLNIYIYLGSLSGTTSPIEDGISPSRKMNYLSSSRNGPSKTPHQAPSPS